LNTETFNRLISVIRQQEVNQIRTMACLLELAKLVPVGETRGVYIQRIEELLEGMHKQHELVNHLTGEDADEDGGEDAI
jgi:hypothetical protein